MDSDKFKISEQNMQGKGVSNRGLQSKVFDNDKALILLTKYRDSFFIGFSFEETGAKIIKVYTEGRN